MSPEDKKQFVQRLEISSLKILKRRVNLSQDKIGATTVTKFSDNEITDVVAETRKPKNESSFVTNITERGSVKQVDIEVSEKEGLYFITLELKAGALVLVSFNGFI